VTSDSGVDSRLGMQPPGLGAKPGLLTRVVKLISELLEHMEPDADKADGFFDPVEEASQESFPASDSPAWAMGDQIIPAPAKVSNATVSNNEAESRFELHVGGQITFLVYRRTPHEITLTHAETPREMEGRGLGSKVVRAALDFAREQDLKVVPRCPFVAWYIQQHQEYADLVRPD